MFKEVFDKDICKACGGQCCKNCSCVAHPSDFGATTEEVLKNLEDAFESGMWIIDYWDGGCPGLPEDSWGYFVRPRNVGDHPDGIKVGSWGGQCLFFTEEKGCLLPDEARPMGGRTLEPRADDKCVQHAAYKGGNEKPTFAIAWYPYEDALTEIITRRNNTIKE